MVVYYDYDSSHFERIKIRTSSVDIFDIGQSLGVCLDTCRPAEVELWDILPGLLEYLFFCRSIRASRCRSMSALWMLFRASKLLAATELCRRSSEDDMKPPLLLSWKRRAPRPPPAARVWKSRGNSASPAEIMGSFLFSRPADGGIQEVKT